MATKDNKYSYEEICRDITAKKFAPVYILMGEEPYFIDKIELLLEQNVLNDSERDFNQTIFYGADTNADTIINAARRFPMMAERQLVIVKEAQSLKNIEYLSHYVNKPMQSTVFVICHKYKKIDGRKSLVPAAKKVGIVFESSKIYEDKVPGFIMSFAKQRNINIDGKSTQMLADFIGNNLSRIEKELEKIQIILKENKSDTITPELIEKNIGISKEFNSFELVNAIASKDVLRANRIANYFNNNQKANPIQVVLPTIFNYFTNLMICLYAKNKSERDIMNTLNLRWSFQAKDYLSGIRNYNAMKVYNIIHEIRISDAKSKGFENASATTGDIYKELLYFILH